jgi:hypothetical protein
MMIQRMSVRLYVGVVVLLALNWHVLQSGQPLYRTIDVQKAGSVHGTVRMTGSVPDMKVPTGKDDKICGASVLLSKLSTGRNGSVKNALVYIQNIEAGKASNTDRKYLLDQRGCMYNPHVMVLPFGSPLEIVNSDPVLHNVHISELGSSGLSIMNIAQPIKGQKSVVQASQIRKPGFYVATCDAGHPWMNAYVIVAEHPYFAVTDADGNYSIDGIPPGEYRLIMWHEGVRVARVDSDKGRTVRYRYEDPYVTESHVTVSQGLPVRVDFKLQLR